MWKIVKFSFSLFFIFCLSLIITSCADKNNSSSTLKNVAINDVHYSSLSEAVDNSKSGDTIEIYGDVKDYKNIIIDKPITLKGVSDSNDIKPKFYGSLTINLSGEQDSLSVENIEIIHDGNTDSDINNNQTIGINLINGGLVVKHSTIGTTSPSSNKENVSGLVISRSTDSNNQMPIQLIGNSFLSYETNGLSSALIIKSNKADEFKNIIINEEEIYNNNDFLTKNPSNQMISIDYSTQPESYKFFVTSSIKNFIDAIENYQNSKSSSFYLYGGTEQKLENTNKNITSKANTNLQISSTSPLDFSNTIINVEGSLNIDGKVENLNPKPASSTASIINNSK